MEAQTGISRKEFALVNGSELIFDEDFSVKTTQMKEYNFILKDPNYKDIVNDFDIIKKIS